MIFKKKPTSLKIVKLIVFLPFTVITFPIYMIFALIQAEDWVDYRWYLKDWFWED